MHHAFLYISLPSLHDYHVKMPNFTFCEGRKQAMTKFILFMNLNMVDRNSAPEEFACIWESKWVRLITIETEKMWIHFSMRRFRGCQPSWYLLKTLYTYLRKTRPMQASGIPVVSWSLYFWKSVFSFRADSILKSDGDFTLNWKFPDCVHFFGAWAKQAVIETIAFVYEHTKRSQEMCCPIGHNDTKHFLCPIGSRHLLEFLEMVQWESVPRGSSTLTWKLLSRLTAPGSPRMV